MFRRLMDPKTKSFRYGGLIVDLYLLNLVFFLTSGLGLLLGPALLALSSVNAAQIDKGQTRILSCYFHDFKANFCKGLAFELVVYIGVLLMVISILTARIVGGVVFYLTLSALFIVAVLLFLIVLIAVPYMAKYQDTFRHSLKVSIQIGMLNGVSVLKVALALAMVIALFGISQITATVVTILLVLLGVSGIRYLSDVVVFQIIRQYEQ